RDAIRFAWSFLTDVLHLSPEKLWVTVFKDDKEAEDIWLNEMKIDPKRFSRCGEDSNFWSMGPTGPCGPCTEIFYDHGEHIVGGPPGSPDEDGDRYVEIWNLVFMQYDRAADGSLTPLPKPSVDTGMGLERIAAVMQQVHNNYDIDLFQHLIQAIAVLANIQDLKHISLRVIADHIRSCAFLITDGVIPSNEGRGYVLRRIIRRALRHGNQLGFTEPFFYKLVKPLVKEMGAAFPELAKAEAHIEKTLRQEEEQFNVTLTQGLKVFEQAVTELKSPIIPGDIVFKLYDTYGFPADLTADIARERGLVLDDEGFETAMNEQRQRSRQSSKFTADYHVGSQLGLQTEFVGHHISDITPKTATILALYREGKSVDTLQAGEKGSVILDRTPFYAESGGQVGDQGILRNDKSLFRVVDTQKEGQAHIHIGHLEKHFLTVGDILTTEINIEKRAATVLNHTATHLLHMILRQVLGEHVIQKGSLVDPDRLRFDFSHPSPLTQDELNIIEQRLNAEIRSNNEAIVKVTSPEEAIKSGAMALFGEKYGDQVRMVRFGESLELCGGTHVHHTGDIGIFKIITETGIAAGIRRIEAVTGEVALRWLEKRDIEYKQKLQQAEERTRLLEKQLEQLKEKLANSMSNDLIENVRDINGVKVLATQVNDADTKSLRIAVDQLKNKLGSAVIALATANDTKASIVVGITKDYNSTMKAGELVNMIAQQIGGKGGGRPDLAEAGGNQPEHLKTALESVYEWVKTKRQ
ncbi:MAG: alanine--tRNA ligase, partial [Gammaproteobacteria bacterium]|nr:alanine--tRNA ligase [Gammaproteobacteria bacterium]